MSDNPAVLFPSLSGDDASTTQVESLCLNCEKNGITRLLFTKIPHFREIVISAFECEHCGATNNEVQSAGAIQEKGVKMTLKISETKDLSRQIVRSDSATLTIPEVEFEIPGKTQKGSLTTVEGVIDRACTGLLQDQDVRRVQMPDVAAQIDGFVKRMKQLLELKQPFTLILDDPAGNSFIENPHAPDPDPALTTDSYIRTIQQDQMLGLASTEGGDSGKTLGVEPGPLNLEGPEEVLEIPSNCPRCQAPCAVRMKPIEIPYFKEVVIMAMSCDSCGHKDNEVKSGGAIEQKGQRITLRVMNKFDLNRDILKSHSCCLKIPEIEFETQHGTLGGRFTTVEGLLTSIRDQLVNDNPFVMGDSSEADEMSGKMKKFVTQLNKIISGERHATLIIEDPAGNSYLQTLGDNGEPDEQMTVERYTRSHAEDEMLGLNDMNTTDYQQT